MLLFFIATSWLIFILYFLYRIGKAYFGRSFLPAEGKEKLSSHPFFTLIIPARNEEANIERCLTSFINQTYPHNKYKVIVVDDNSSDNTAAIVKRLKEGCPNVHLVKTGELPQGWTGKNNACRTGVEHAEGEWYCFVDADVSAEGQLIERALNFALARGADLLSINPFQELVSIAERLFLPGIFLSIASSINFSHVNNPEKPESLANGQFMLFKKSTYKKIGGHDAIRSEVMDDLAFARIIKEGGHRLYLLFADDMIRTRMYRELPQIWKGFSKNLIEIMKHESTITSVTHSIKFLFLGWMPVVLPLLTFYRPGACGNDPIYSWAFAIALAGSIIMFITCFMAIKALKIPALYLLSFPLGFTMHAFITLNCLWQSKRGNIEWKGRTYS
ncbi:MAG: glycosyltransferase [Deltaproteobacteria bacterium]|nr:glycosyltransferase [Deltaproteobacteria bacterium]